MSSQVAEFNPMATMDDVVAAFRLFLNRTPGEEGYNHFQDFVDRGLSVEALSNLFASCEEYGKRQASGIVDVDMGGFFVCVDPKETEIGQWVVEQHDYEPHVRQAVVDHFRAGQTFVDLGANVGCITMLAAKIAGPAGRVIAVEPNPTNQQRLYAGIVRNGFTNVRVMPYAASDRRTTFSVTGGSSNTHITDARGTDVQTVYTQSMVPDEDLADLSSIDVIKMDIEGHETFALRGFSKLIRKHSPTLIVELCPIAHEARGHDPMEFLEVLFDLYPRTTVTTRYGDSVEFSDPTDLMAYWRKRDAELSAEGWTRPGVLHFDLISKPDGR